MDPPLLGSIPSPGCAGRAPPGSPFPNVQRPAARPSHPAPRGAVAAAGWSVGDGPPPSRQLCPLPDDDRAPGATEGPRAQRRPFRTRRTRGEGLRGPGSRRSAEPRPPARGRQVSGAPPPPRDPRDAAAAPEPPGLQRALPVRRGPQTGLRSGRAGAAGARSPSPCALRAAPGEAAAEGAGRGRPEARCAGPAGPGDAGKEAGAWRAR